jgi:hypothetical protein
VSEPIDRPLGLVDGLLRFLEVGSGPSQGVLPVDALEGDLVLPFESITQILTRI